MVLFYQAPKPPKAQGKCLVEIKDLDYQGLGVAKIKGKTWFIENGLPQEQVEIKILEEKRQYGRGIAQKILKASPQRQQPICPYYQQCGGCQSQHIAIELQREAKQRALLQRLSQLQPDVALMPMLCGDSWHYRRRIRLSIVYQNKTVQIGFRQKNTQQIVPIRHCAVIEPALNEILEKLTALFQQWSTPKQLGHIELVNADNGVAMLLRHTQNLRETDRTLLCEFAAQHRIMLFVQDDQQIQHLVGESPYYQLDNGLHLSFDIRDFIQVNRQLNQKMIDTALSWLDLQPQDHLLDLFCGMGNFTLPISQHVQSAVGIEGVFEMVQKAQKNAEQNQCHNVKFYRADLEQPFMQQDWAKQPFNKILLDPARSGAAFALPHLCQLAAEKILYVSCNPATLVRDAEILCQAGYQLKKVAMVDMFPHTAHLESISLFEKE